MLTSNALVHSLSAMARVISNEALLLGQLDAAIGDGDHGVNMVVGLHAVEEDLPAFVGHDIGSILGDVGARIAAIGGASGPLYSAAFASAARAAGHVHAVDVTGVAAMLEAACESVARRGRAAPGEKTMLDTLDRAAREARRCATAGITGPLAADCIAAAAAAGLLSTAAMLPRRGRARWLHQRAVDHLDPGAASCYLIIATACGRDVSLAPLVKVSTPSGRVTT
jgi:dihydroxyacetone kinase-like protein